MAQRSNHRWLLPVFSKVWTSVAGDQHTELYTLCSLHCWYRYTFSDHTIYWKRRPRLKTVSSWSTRRLFNVCWPLTCAWLVLNKLWLYQPKGQRNMTSAVKLSVRTLCSILTTLFGTSERCLERFTTTSGRGGETVSSFGQCNHTSDNCNRRIEQWSILMSDLMYQD